MMSESKHTATPYRKVRTTDVESHNCPFAIVGPHQNVKAGEFVAYHLSENDAAFIVEACNNYDFLKARNAQLVKALKEIVDPIAVMQSELGPGEKLDGRVASELSNSAAYLKGLARKVLDES